MIAHKLFRLEYFRVNNREVWYLGVPFEQGGGAADEPMRQPIQLPHGRHDLVVVRVNNVSIAMRVPGQMALNDSLVRQGADVFRSRD